MAQATRTALRNTPLVLIIRDGWGANPHPEHDAFNAVKIASARGLTPVADRLMREYPWTLIKTSGEDVGLPDGTMGNSEVGHQNIGAGRVVDQESVAITKACRPPRGLEGNAAIAAAMAAAKTSGGRMHLLCINSDAGVHGQLEHLFACVRAAKALGVPGERVLIHLFTDGRDTGPYTGVEFARRVEAACREIGAGRVATVCGRYFAMDRDHRWERVKRCYDLLTGRDDGVPGFDTAVAAIEDHYDRPADEGLKGDEFVGPRRVGAAVRIADGDSVIFVNYRGDRPRELCAALCFPDEVWAKVKPSPDSGVKGFERGARPKTHFVVMTEYWDALKPHVQGVAFPKPPKMKHIAGEWVSALGLRQFRCAETEKYPHVTFFFNDYREEPFAGERRENPQSPKVATYDLKPEMSAGEVCGAVLRRLSAPAGEREEVIVVNFANGDMVGHTGSLEATVKACAAVDACVGRIVEATLALGGSLMVAADHGNAEQMFDPATNAPHTAHTIYDVPLIVVGAAYKGRPPGVLRGDADVSKWFDAAARAKRGRLADVMPTALAMMGAEQPAEMTGESLLREGTGH